MQFAMRLSTVIDRAPLMARGVLKEPLLLIPAEQTEEVAGQTRPETPIVLGIAKIGAWIAFGRAVWQSGVSW